MSFFTLQSYGCCWRISEEIFEQAIAELEIFCIERYGSLDLEQSSTAKFEIWVYRRL
ncbi:hypothetical protein [Pseudanabaena sp. UWO310]|uniref:hypothetical protein n=1 Tax=Pseudanabaena sp. UWO310 TaxID=2480795 RepID=UPI0016804161|nr:hypothetical protein [Pseudanabaena sp. UWO310]